MKKQLKSIKTWLKVIAILIFAHLLFLITCVGAYGQVGDCPAQLICASSGTYTCVVDGIDELNVTNNGCLAVNEGVTSYWIELCTVTAGNITFGINPGGAGNDYDWAVWQGSACPPVGMPIRCSFAIPGGPFGDQTGVSSTNNAPQVDLTEGAGGNNWVQDIVAPAGQCYIICINKYGILGLNTFTFTYGGSALLLCNPLPVDLLTFEGFYENKVVTLDWATASETNSSHFIIEKMGNNFEINEIGRVESSGNSNEIKQYGFIDLNPYKGINYYRLVQYDFDGNFKAYNWISILVPDDNDKCCKEYFDLLGKSVNFETAPNGIYLGLTEDGNIIKIKK